ncbi:YicC family protein [Ignavibacteria bacterium]|nr:YicC family protein [Bacteroidota bacterium]MCZ2132421.1 YicC family protein [Bacteroidota bacterium]
MNSMTGFAKSETTENGITATVEIRSVNGKYLDASIRLPRSLATKENDARDIIRKAVSRGNISVNINVEGAKNSAPKFNEDIAVEHFTALKNLSKKLKIKEQPGLSDLLHFSQNLWESSADEQTEQTWAIVQKTLAESLQYLDAARKNEGKELAKDLKNRIKRIEDILAKIEEKSARRVPEEREKIRQRIAQLFESDEIDEQRLQMEIVLLADRLDISEECVRLRSHIKFYHDLLKSPEPVGRKMNFLLQELHREINTIGSKANDAEIAHHVVEVKEELERIREQTQNIE